MKDLNKEREVDTLPEVAHLLEQCKHRDLTLIERAFVKGARYAWQEKAKAQVVPEGYFLVPKEIPDSVVSCLENSGFHWGDGTRDHYTPIYSLMVEVASESGAEG